MENPELPNFNQRLCILGLAPDRAGLAFLADIANVDAGQLREQYERGRFTPEMQRAVFGAFKGTLPAITEDDIPALFSKSEMAVVQTPGRKPITQNVDIGIQDEEDPAARRRREVDELLDKGRQRRAQEWEGRLGEARRSSNRLEPYSGLRAGAPDKSEKGGR